MVQIRGMEALCESILVQLHNLETSDPILECGKNIGARLFDETDALRDLAEQKLRVFPFKDVKRRWFRLFTDVYLLKAVRLIQRVSDNTSGTSETFDTIIKTLDIALIMAGGLQREELIHGLFSELHARSALEEASHHSSKRRKLNHDGSRPTEVTQFLPTEESSVPDISYGPTMLRSPSMSAFHKHMTTSKSPALLADVISHWPALERWKSQSYWLERTIGGRRLVPVEIGRSYTDDEWTQQILPFRTFLYTYVCRIPESVPCSESDEPRTGYLAQHDLFKQIPSLCMDVVTPDYCFLDAPPPEPDSPVALSKMQAPKANGEHTSHPSLIAQPSRDSTALRPDAFEGDTGDAETNEVHKNVWFGPAWTVTPLHHDPYHNILCQVVGKKYIRLYSPKHSDKLFAKSKKEPASFQQETGGCEFDYGDDTGGKSSPQVQSPTIDMSNTSEVDFAAMELSPMEDWDDVYPGISEIPYVECVLEPGQALYIPVGWWHYVRSCSVGISVSFWW